MVMKYWILVLLFFVSCLAAIAQSPMQEEFNSLSPEDQELLSKEVGLVDQGLTETAAPVFDLLAQKYPRNYLVQYERLFNLYKLGRYDEIIKARKFMLKHKCTSERAYQLIGNAFDMSGDRKTAIKIYEEGVKRFPGSGALYLELGNVNQLNGEYSKALECYNRGILAQPNFASNYYRAAQLYFASDFGKVWGLVYAESEILLAPANEARHKEMSQSIVDCLKENITITYAEEDSISVNLVPTRELNIDRKTNGVYIGFPGVYEGALGQSLVKLITEKKPFDCSLSQLIEIRKGAVEAYYKVTDNMYGSSMYLLEFQKKIIDAGHWEAYNYFLFMPTFPDEFEAWYSADRAPMDAFIEWYNNATYTLGDGRSVDPMQIFNHYQPVDLFRSLQIQSQLIIDYKTKDEAEE